MSLEAKFLEVVRNVGEIFLSVRLCFFFVFQSLLNLLYTSRDMADINIVGVVAIIVFYLLILVIGLWAARRRKEGEEEAMLAGRSIGIFVGTFTMTGNKGFLHVTKDRLSAIFLRSFVYKSAVKLLTLRMFSLRIYYEAFGHNSMLLCSFSFQQSSFHTILLFFLPFVYRGLHF